ncbi:CHAT domain-containing protein [Streptomyces sp. NPDC085481]|uniref:CHAT domain-containing protein n=1 Tax=Streptomyces sp. NPDC085481 TaxID=3365727 RepID=UPI0037D7F651
MPADPGRGRGYGHPLDAAAHAAFDAAVDELRASPLAHVDPTPAQWRRTLREDNEAEDLRTALGTLRERFAPVRTEDAPWDQSALAAHLHHLGTAVLRQWDRTGDPYAVLMACAVWRDLLATVWLTDIVSPLAALSARFLGRYAATPDLPLLDAAVRLGRDAVFDTAAFGTTRPERLLVCADALRCRHEHTGDRAALVEAEAHYAEARGTAREGERERAEGGLAAVRAHRRALTAPAAAPPSALPGPLAEAAALTDHAAERLARFRAAGDSAGLDEAVAALRRALALTPDDHRDLPLRLTRLGSALHAAHLRRPAPATVEEAVAACRAALALPIDRPALRTEATAVLATALVSRYEAEGGRPVHLAEAGLLAAELAHAHPPGHPARDGVLADLAGLLPDADRPAPAPEGPRRAENLLDLARSLPAAEADRALAAYAEAARTPGAPLLVRGLASQEWARAAAGRGDLRAAETAYRLTVDLLPELVADLERRDDQEYRLLPFAGLASDAAACVLGRGGSPAEALSLLERGRCVLFSRALGEEPVPVDEVVRAQVAAGGPVVVVNVSRLGSHALVLTAAGILTVPLPGLTPAAVEDRRIALDLAQDLLRTPEADPGLRWAAGRSVSRLLGWLWDTVAGPVLDTLGLAASPGARTPGMTGETPPRPLPRLWWLPTGQLSLLPLHAAGHHAAGDGRTVPDRVVSSTVPTLRQLLRARARTARRPADRSLVVAIGDLPGYRLPAAAGEAELARAHLPGARLLADAAARPEAVREALGDAAWVHIACHATTDVADPSANRLALAGGDLSVAEIGRMRNPDAHFAFLSACGTARGGDALSDEVVHISSAFQLAGYAHVIGTLWPIVDDVAARVAAEVYAGLSDGADPARLLHAATLAVRDEYAGNSPLLWASHLHIGP